jgi:TonB family protein
MQTKPVTFLKLPEYPGGKESIKQFIRQHLQYPQEALKHNIEGIVYLSAEITHKGEVMHIRVEKGIGYGCDEEATRVVSLMKFGGAKNRGVKIKTRKKFKISFRLPEKKETTYTYSYKKERGESQKPSEHPTVYSYTLHTQSKD